jgi:hypothetical protein
MGAMENTDSENFSKQKKESGIELLKPLQSPHKKSNLTTPLGRFIDRLSFFRLLIAALVLITISSTYFYLAPEGNGLVIAGVKEVSYSESVYFSIVTFTSLGYGDILPQGFGRWVSGSTVFSGLILVSLLIGKLASERQTSMLRLLHNSDSERRIKGFSQRIGDLKDAASAAYAENNAKKFGLANREFLGNFIAMYQYLIFNSNQAQLTESNTAAFSALYSQLLLALRAYVAFFEADLSVSASQRSFDIIVRIHGLSVLMTSFHRQSIVKAPWFHKLNYAVNKRSLPLLGRNIESFEDGQGKVQSILEILARIHEDGTIFIKKARAQKNNWIRERVYIEVPDGPLDLWHRHAHKAIAARLNISNTLAQACIDDLLMRDRLPKNQKSKIKK